MTEDVFEATVEAVPTRPVSRRTWLAIAVVAVLLAAPGAFLTWLLRPGEGPLTDPKHTSDDPAWGAERIKACIQPDADFEWFEMTSLGNSGTTPLTIDGVEVGGTANVEVVGTTVVPLEGDAAGLPAWGSPPSRETDGPVEELIRFGVRVDQRTPAIGHRVAPGDRPAILMVGVRPVGDTVGRMDTVTVRYHVGWRHYRRALHHEVAVFRKNTC